MITQEVIQENLRKIKTWIKKSIKTFLKSDLARLLFSYIAAKYIKLVFSTTRWTIIGQQIPQSYIDSKRPFLVCFWHGRLFMLACAWQWKTPFVMLLSAHRDGQLISDTVAYFGIQSIKGSTQKGGTEAVRSIIKTLKSGSVVGITPDGPRGPNQIASEGAATIARLVKVDMVPITFSISPHKLLKTWDSFMIPLPFGKGIIRWSEPILYNEGASVETQTTILREQLNKNQTIADDLLDL